MKDLNADYVRDYIYYYAKNYTSLEILQWMIGVYAFLTFFACVASIMSNTLINGIIMVFLTLLYTIVVLVFQKKADQVNSFSLRFLVTGIFGAFSAIYFLLFACTFLDATRHGTLPSKAVLLLLLLLFTFIFHFTVLRNVIKGRYTEKNMKKPKVSKVVVLCASIGTVLGISAARLFAPILAKHQAVVAGILVLGFTGVGCLFAIGTTQLWAYYFCKKFGITCDEDGENTSILLTHYDKVPKQKMSKRKIKKKMSPLKKAFLIILLVIVAILTILAVIGYLAGPAD